MVLEYRSNVRRRTAWHVNFNFGGNVLGPDGQQVLRPRLMSFLTTVDYLNIRIIWLFSLGSWGSSPTKIFLNTPHGAVHSKAMKNYMDFS